jgi:protocatechuate 3,4-dioxygenase beta subunit
MMPSEEEGAAQQTDLLLQAEEEEEEKQACSLKPTLGLVWGPGWYPGHALHEASSADAPVVICNRPDNDDDDVLIKATSVFTRSAIIKPAGGIVFQLRGRVLDSTTCKPIPNAVVDFWQPDNRGRYSTSHDGHCRGAVLTDRQGQYAIQTVLSGNYGITSGLGLWGIELPPYSLAHLHVAVFAPHFNVMTTQLAFPDDAVRGRDFREFFGSLVDGIKYELSHESLILDIQQQVSGPTMATFDFVIANKTTNESITGRDLFENRDALKKAICRADGFQPAEPFPLCQGGKRAQQHGTVSKLVYTHVPMRIIMILMGPCLFYGVPILILTMFCYLIRFMMSGSKNKKKNKTKND